MNVIGHKHIFGIVDNIIILLYVFAKCGIWWTTGHLIIGKETLEHFW